MGQKIENTDRTNETKALLELALAMLDEDMNFQTAALVSAALDSLAHVQPVRTGKLAWEGVKTAGFMADWENLVDRF